MQKRAGECYDSRTTEARHASPLSPATPHPREFRKPAGPATCAGLQTRDGPYHLNVRREWYTRITRAPLANP